MKIEVFTAGCKFCGDVESQVRKIVAGKHEVTVYNLNDESHPNEYYEAAKNYGLNSLPSVVVNGELLTCCNRKGFDPEILTQALG
jgi:glutaredoxin